MTEEIDAEEEVSTDSVKTSRGGRPPKKAASQEKVDSGLLCLAGNGYLMRVEQLSESEDG